MNKRCFYVMLLLLISILLGGCSNKENEGANLADTYRYTPLGLVNDDEISTYASFFANDSLYYISVDYEKLHNATSEEMKKGWKDTGEVCKYDCSTDERRVLFTIEYGSDIDAMYVDDKENISVVSGDSFAKYSADGKELIKKSLVGEIYSNSDTEYYSSMCRFERDGALYIAGREGKAYIYKLDSDGNYLGMLQSEEYVDDFVIDNEGNFIVISGSSVGLKCTEYDFNSGKKNETITIENQNDLYYFGNGNEHGCATARCAYNGYGDISFLLRDSTGLYSYNSQTGEIKLIFEWLSAGIIGEYVQGIELLSDGRMFCICMDNMLNFEAGFVEKIDNPKEKTVIKCAALYPEGDFAHDLQKCVVDFNRKQDDIYVEIISYEKSNSPISQFAQDIVTGNIPDVIDISSVEIDNYISKGLFEDLLPYMEKDDVLNKDYYVDGLLDSVEIDGKHYFAFKGFFLNTLAGKASDLTKYGDSWSMSDMIEYYNSKPEGTHLYMYDSKEYVYDEFIAANVQDYIDWETGSVHFDSDEFKQMLEFIKQFPDDTDVGVDYNDVKRDILEGKTLLNIVGLSSWGHHYKLNESFYEGDTRYIGFPSSDGKIAYIEPIKGTLAISSTSEHKEESWEFLKYVITEGDFENTGLPAGKKDFDNMVKAMTTRESYFDENGDYVEPLKGESGWNNLDVEITPYSEEDIQIIKELIAKGKLTTGNHQVSDIIKNELIDYFDDRKSLDEIIAVIQDKVGKYVNENR